jgi:hypothetical protein
MMITAHLEYGIKIIQLFSRPKKGGLKYIKHSNTCETVAKNKDKEVAKLRNNDLAQYHRNWPVP